VANQITDGRTAVAVAQTSAPASETWEASGGGGSVVEDVDIFIQGTTSVAEQISTSRRVMLYDVGSTQNWSNNVFYIWVNCGIVGLLDIKANGGMTVRFTGPTSTNFFEFYVGGSDSWPVAVAGGWTMFVVDVEGTPSNTGGTPPATSAIQKVGITAVTATVMTKASDNTWVDAIWRLPDGSPGIIVEGRSGGTTPWTFADILTQLGQAPGMFKQTTGGAYAINAPLQIGINDTTTHEFDDSNVLLLWEDQEFAPTDLYRISALGNAGGTTNVTFGIKAGTGNAATGSQGVTIQAAAGGVRWAMDFNDPNLDSVGLYGCSFAHGGTFDLDDPAVDLASCFFIDCDKAHVSNAKIVRATVIDANTATANAFMDTDDLGDIVFSNFQFSAGHGIEVLSGGPATQNDIGNLFSGAFGGTPGSNLTASSGSNDAMIYNNAGAAKTFNGSDGATTPSFRNGASATSTYANNVTITFTPLVANSEFRAYLTGTNTEVDGVENSGASFVLSVGSGVAIDYVIINPGYVDIRVNNVSFTTSQNVIINQQIDRNFNRDPA